MKQILITDALYTQLRAAADERNELIETFACFYLERGLGELDRLETELKEAEAEAEFSEAQYENRFNHKMRKH